MPVLAESGGGPVRTREGPGLGSSGPHHSQQGPWASGLWTLEGRCHSPTLCQATGHLVGPQTQPSSPFLDLLPRHPHPQTSGSSSFAFSPILEPVKRD